LSRERVDLILHEECNVDWLLDTLEGSCGFAFSGEHVFDVGARRVDEAIILIEASRFHFGALFLLV